MKRTTEFTKREVQVIRLICRGMNNQEIAEKLGISNRTIESHREKIYKKAGVKNIATLVVYAIKKDIFKI